MLVNTAPRCAVRILLTQHDMHIVTQHESIGRTGRTMCRLLWANIVPQLT